MALWVLHHKAITALIALALFSDHPELVADADKTWGVASRELLGPGLTGLMLACLLAALMSSVYVGGAWFLTKILPTFLVMPMFYMAMPLSGLVGLYFAWQYNKQGKRVRILGSSSEDDSPE